MRKRDNKRIFVRFSKEEVELIRLVAETYLDMTSACFIRLLIMDYLWSENEEKNKRLGISGDEKESAVKEVSSSE